MKINEASADLYLPLSQGQVSVIDFDDRHIVEGKKYYANYDKNTRTFYAVRNTTKAEREAGLPANIHLQRELMGFPKGKVVHHRNHDTLDNRRSNLEVTTNRQNGQARAGADRGSISKFIGVCWYKQTSKWKAYLKRPGIKSEHIGYFDCEREAAIARDTLAHEWNTNHGCIFTLNFSELFEV